MIQKYTGEEIHLIPSIHDYKIGDIVIKENSVIFTFDDIDVYDATDFYCKGAKKLELTFTVNDWDFCQVDYAKSVPYRLKWLLKPTFKSVSFEMFLKRIDLDKEKVDVLTLLTAYQTIQVECYAYNYDLLNINLNVTNVTFNWITV